MKSGSKLLRVVSAALAVIGACTGVRPAAADDGCHPWASATAYPDPRSEHALAHDSARDSVVMFGGLANPVVRQWPPTVADDTWELRGSIWQRVESGATNPPPRFGALMAFDASCSRTVLIGGMGESYFEPKPLSDIWHFDGKSWSPEGTLENFVSAQGAALVYDPVNRVLVLASNRGVLVRDQGVWSHAVVTGAGPGWDLSAGCFNTTDGVSVFVRGCHYCGSEGTPLFELRLVKAEDGRWLGTWTTRVSSSGSPPAREGATLADNPALGGVILFGGTVLDWGSAPLDDLWLWKGTQWQPLTPAPGPVGKVHARMVWDAGRARAVLVAGRSHFSTDADAWELDERGWTSIDASPGRAQFGAMTYDSVRHRAVYFGGSIRRQRGLGPVPSSEWTSLTSTHEYDGEAWTALDVPGPGPRCGHTMVYDPDRRVTLLVGGGSFTSLPGPITMKSDTWTWDGSRWQQAALNGPGPRFNARAAFDPVSRRVILTSGSHQIGSTSEYSDLWSWNGTAWAPVLATALPGRVVAMGVDPQINRIVALFGPDLYPCPNPEFRTAIWDGTGWTEVGRSRIPTDVIYGITETGVAGHLMQAPSALDASLVWVTQGPQAVELWTLHGNSWAQSHVPEEIATEHMYYDPVKDRIIGIAGWVDGGMTRPMAWNNQVGPTILTQPAVVRSTLGARTTLGVTFEAPPGTVTGIEWWDDETHKPVPDAPPYEGQGTAQLTITSVSSATTHAYWARISTVCGDFDSKNGRILAWPCREDFSRNGVIDTFDVLSLLDAFGRACTFPCQFDLAEDGTLNTRDLVRLLSLFGQRCPTEPAQTP